MDIGERLKPKKPTIKIGKNGTDVELLGKKPEEVKSLIVYGYNKSADLSLLNDYPNVEKLILSGDFANVDDISSLKSLNWLSLYPDSDIPLKNLRIPGLKSLSLNKKLCDGYEGLLTESLEYLELEEIRKLSDLSFVERLTGLKKLYLNALPAVEKLPDFGKMPALYGLKIYELHKLNDLEILTKSAIRYLDLTLAADKLSGTKIADVLLCMERLERFSGSLDRSCKRDDVLENRLEKAGKSDICNKFDMSEWLEL